MTCRSLLLVWVAVSALVSADIAQAKEVDADRSGGPSFSVQQEAPPRPLAGACYGLGLAVSPVLEALTWGDYDPHSWADDRGYCLTILGNSAMGIAAVVVDEVGHPTTPEVFGAGSFDRFFRNALWSRSSTDNFFDGSAGAVFPPLVASGAMMLTASMVGGRSAYADSVTRAVPLLWMGIAGAQLPVNVFKKGFGRERPYLKFDNQQALLEFGNNDEARESFYSGHTTTAFFTATFADAVLADIVRSGYPDYSLTADSWDQRLARLAQFLGLYGLAVAVAYSRIEIDKHYMTDVLMGAAFGSTQAYLTYRWGYRTAPLAAASVSTLPGGHGISVTWRF